ncbi:M1 family metallopeptidase [Nocardioides zeae]|uniref:Aminopeptidase N n=1 Tax=Nocardioides imazamoxiresistens TaxID=3231893 RepID=A0ABU3PVR1_9ACTN|nr:M1 family metallopeptidase [Nocardioides zeae]MDT9593318.1 M1 family metallopeptidase [Nocardioides zeae]
MSWPSPPPGPAPEPERHEPTPPQPPGPGLDDGPTSPDRPVLPEHRAPQPRPEPAPQPTPQPQPTPHAPPPGPAGAPGPAGPTALPARPPRAPRRGRTDGRVGGWTVFLVALVSAAVGAAGAVVAVGAVVDRDDRDRSSEERGADGADGSDGSAGEGAADLPPVATPAEAELATAVSRPRADSVYPEVGDPVVDALHYAIELAWFPETDELVGTTTVTFRATTTQDSFALDLAGNLEVDDVTIDGASVEWEHAGDDLTVGVPVTAEERYAVTVAYAGPPTPTAAPTTRSDFDGGLGITRSEEPGYEDWLWTMQEPYGAFTWYPANDHPSDKALYDITVRTTPEWRGVANGVQVEEVRTDTETVTRFHTDAPLPTYLATVAVGDYELTEDVSESGVDLTYWTPAGEDGLLAMLEETPAALAFVEDLLGPYPFSSLGSVVVPSESAMETQTMITYGNTDYALSVPTLVHEIAHHWYGNKVSPADWSDVWMNEGMATYVQMLYEAEAGGYTDDELASYYAAMDAGLRAEAGPPAAYDPDQFAQSNIYVIPAVMWHDLRTQVGDDRFWAMVRAWPTHPGDGFVSSDRGAYLPWVGQQLGTDLTGFFDAWLLGETTPPLSFGEAAS